MSGNTALRIFIFSRLAEGLIACCTPLERVLRYEGLLARFNGHKTGGEFVSYTGNGYIGLRYFAPSLSRMFRLGAEFGVIIIY